MRLGGAASCGHAIGQGKLRPWTTTKPLANVALGCSVRLLSLWSHWPTKFMGGNWILCELLGLLDN